MVRWIGIRPDLLPKVMLRPMAWITLRLFSGRSIELHLDSILSCCQPVVALVPAVYQECLLYGDLQEEGYMEQPLGMLLREKIKLVLSGRQYMDLSRVHGHGL